MSYTLNFSGSEINTLLQKVNNVNQPDGVVGLDENGKIDEALLPDEINAKDHIVWQQSVFDNFKLITGLGTSKYIQFIDYPELTRPILSDAPVEYPFTVPHTISSTSPHEMYWRYYPTGSGHLSKITRQILSFTLNGLIPDMLYDITAKWTLVQSEEEDIITDIASGLVSLVAKSNEEPIQLPLDTISSFEDGLYWSVNDGCFFVLQLKIQTSTPVEHAISYNNTCFRLTEVLPALNTSQVYDPNISFEGNPVATQAQVNTLVQTQMADLESQLANKAEKSTQKIYTIDTGVFTITPNAGVLHADFVTDPQEHYYVQFVDVDLFYLFKDYARTIVAGAGQFFGINMDRLIYPGISLADGDVVQFKSIAADRLSFTMGYAGVTEYQFPETITINENEKVTILFQEYRIKYNSNNDVGIRMRWDFPNSNVIAWLQSSSGMSIIPANYNDTEIGRAIPTYAKYITNNAMYTIIRQGTKIQGQLQGTAMSCASYNVHSASINIAEFPSRGQRFENVQAGSVSISKLFNGVTGRTGHLIGNGSKYIVIREPLTEV